MESSSKWDGITKVNSSEGIDTYNDTNRLTIYAYIYAPKDYDGLMIALNKNGTSKEIVLKQIEFNNKYKVILEKNGLIFSGINEQTDLVEIIELPTNKFHLACQFHPEFKSRPTNPHPLFDKFIKSSLEK